MQDHSPPTTGAAVRAETSAPTPDSQSKGSRPSTVVATVITSGRTRALAPSTTAASTSCRVLDTAFTHVPQEGFVQVHHHDDARLGGNACDRDQSNPDRGRQIVVHEIQQPDAARDGERQTG